MAKNVGITDRIIRIVVGIILFFTGYVTHYIWLIIGLILFVTGLFGWCPLYKIFGISTAKMKKEHLP